MLEWQRTRLTLPCGRWYTEVRKVEVEDDEELWPPYQTTTWAGHLIEDFLEFFKEVFSR